CEIPPFSSSSKRFNITSPRCPLQLGDGVGLSKTAMAELLGINRRTIARWIAAGELDRDLSEPPRYKRRTPVPKKLDPFKEIIRERLLAYPALSAVRLLEEIRALGYTGGYSQLRDYVRQVRPKPP